MEDAAGWKVGGVAMASVSPFIRMTRHYAMWWCSCHRTLLAPRLALQSPIRCCMQYSGLKYMQYVYRVLHVIGWRAYQCSIATADHLGTTIQLTSCICPREEMG